MPRVSVVVPNFNHARFLDERIESILAQTYQDYEIILMDDASTDHSTSVLRRYEGHPRVRCLLENEVNTGCPFTQWNRGVLAARGEYVWIAESDDAAEPVLLGTLVERLERHPNVGVAYCQSVAVDEHGGVLYPLSAWTEDLDAERWRSDFVNDGRDECAHYLSLRCTIPNASGAVFRRQVYIDAGMADESFRLAGDWMLWVKLLLRSDIAFVAADLNRFRVHAGTVRQHSTRSAVVLSESMRVFEHLSEYVTVPEPVRERAMEQFFDRWIQLAGRPDVGYRAMARSYRRLRALDPKLLGRTASRALRGATGLRRALSGQRISR